MLGSRVPFLFEAVQLVFILNVFGRLVVKGCEFHVESALFVRKLQRGNIIKVPFQGAVLATHWHIAPKELKACKNDAGSKQVAFDGPRVDGIEASRVAKKQEAFIILVHGRFQKVAGFQPIEPVVTVTIAGFRIKPGQGVFRRNPQVVCVIFHQTQYDIGVKTLLLIVGHQFRPVTWRVISTKHQPVAKRAQPNPS